MYSENPTRQKPCEKLVFQTITMSFRNLRIQSSADFFRNKVVLDSVEDIRRYYHLCR